MSDGYNLNLSSKEKYGIIIFSLIIFIAILTVGLITQKDELDYYKQMEILKCNLIRINESKTPLLQTLANSTDYEILHRELNSNLALNMTDFSITQDKINYTTTIVSTWVFRKLNNTNHEVVIRIFHSLYDYLIGNSDPRAYVYYCDTKELHMYVGSNRYKLGNSLAYQVGDLPDYCYKTWSDSVE